MSAEIEMPPNWDRWPLEAKARYLWLLQARAKQLPPEDEDWLVWLVLAGRGWGKTRTGAEWLANEAKAIDNSRWAVVARTTADGRDVCIEGHTGLLRACTGMIGKNAWNRSLGELRLLNGSFIKTFSSEEPDSLRGYQFHGALCDELGAWTYPDDTWTQLQLGLRLGEHPRVVITTTPRPIDLLRDLIDRPTTRLTRGSTWENKDNLPDSQLKELEARYGGTMIGRQELEAELLEEHGVLWSSPMIDDHRIKNPSPKDWDELLPQLQRIVVAVDPAVTFGEDSDETGIVVAGVTAGDRPHAYVLADVSGSMSTEGWAQRAWSAYALWKADRVIAEVNNGGDLVERTLRFVDEQIAYRAVHASRGKAIRAEPVAALYEQGRVHHVGIFEDLEHQMCGFDPEKPRRRGHSPDRMDALVWALTELMVMSRPEFLGAA